MIGNTLTMVLGYFFGLNLVSGRRSRKRILPTLSPPWDRLVSTYLPNAGEIVDKCCKTVDQQCCFAYNSSNSRARVFYCNNRPRPERLVWMIIVFTLLLYVTTVIFHWQFVALIVAHISVDVRAIPIAFMIVENPRPGCFQYCLRVLRHKQNSLPMLLQQPTV